MVRQAIIYETATGVEPYTEFVDSLRDRQGAAKIRKDIVKAHEYWEDFRRNP